MLSFCFANRFPFTFFFLATSYNYTYNLYGSIDVRYYGVIVYFKILWQSFSIVPRLMCDLHMVYIRHWVYGKKGIHVLGAHVVRTRIKLVKIG